jgi:branched-chain amino acid transport system ATP-binding protein
MMLNVRAIDTYYGETQVLFGVSLRVGAGEIVALLGPSGAGKTTTLRSILGLTPARSGVIEWQDRDISRWATHRISRLGIKWVPDDRRVFPTLSAARNLSIARGTSPFRAYTTAACCEIFPALRNLLARDCENMSGGELQMVSISRALAGGPGLVLFDEPSQGLAPKVVQDVMGTIRSLRDQGVGALVVDQNVRIVLDAADRVYVMHAGRIVHEGQASALRADDSARRALGLADVR